MKALIVTGGEHPPSRFLSKLSQSMDLVIAADSGLSAARSCHVIPDWIIGDFDSLGDMEILAEYAPERILRYPPEKDDTDTELAFRLAADLGCEHVEVAGAGGGRMDHFIAMYAMFMREKHPDAWHTRTESAYWLDRGKTAGLKLKPQSIVSVFPLGDYCSGMNSVGLQWSLAGLCWEKGGFGISNRNVIPDPVISAGSCPLLVVMPLGGEFLL
ncbi:MAG: thiamine diphosphokinase [Spirochaetaceae bacterium]|nr:thiamine diphosphokinase [Spirochaetaceae bacterium]